MTEDQPLRVVLLGASGFVGSAVLRQMESLAQDTQDGTRCEARLLVHRTAPAAVPAFAQVHRGSLADEPAGLLPSEPHVVIHCASKQIDSDGSGYGVNLAGIEQLCRAITPATRAVLFVSSYSVYGEGAQQGVDETAPLQPETALAASRAACEARLAQLAASSSCRVVVLRTRFVLGHGDRHVLPGLAKLARSRLQLGNGRQRYSVIDVDDLARTLLHFAQAALQGRLDAPFEVYNAAYEHAISLQDIRAALAEKLPTRRPWWRVPVSPSFWRVVTRLPSAQLRQLAHRVNLMGLDRYGSVAKLQSALGQPWLKTDPRDVVRRAAQDLNSHPI